MADDGRPSLLKKIPKIDTLLQRPEVEALAESHGRSRVTLALREMVDSLRAQLSAPGAKLRLLETWTEGLVLRLKHQLESDLDSSLKPVLNATGVLVHTNLGRSPLSMEALRRIQEIGSAYATLEYDQEQGERGSRSIHAQRLLEKLFPGTSSHVVNNNAAAVLLALNTLAEGKEVVVSRGELVEIGGSFRIPDVMRKGNAILHEVGTTNRTRLSDYEEAIQENTGLLLKVHTSNYRIVGFTTETHLSELAELGRERNVPVMVDQGSGNLRDLSERGIPEEVTVQELLAQGADLVTFSGDKLLGGPQAGILVGRADLLERIRKNPLSRALRVDKVTYAALEATLAAYVTDSFRRELPVWRMLEASAESVAERAQRCAAAVEKQSSERVQTKIFSGHSLVGGGAAPTAQIPTTLLEIKCRGRTPDQLEEALRKGEPPVIARIRDEKLVLDLRTVPEEREAELIRALTALAEDTK